MLARHSILRGKYAGALHVPGHRGVWALQVPYWRDGASKHQFSDAIHGGADFWEQHVDLGQYPIHMARSWEERSHLPGLSPANCDALMAYRKLLHRCHEQLDANGYVT